MVNSNSNLFLSWFQFANHSNNGKKTTTKQLYEDLCYCTCYCNITKQPVNITTSNKIPV